MDRMLPGDIDGLAIIEVLRKTGKRTPILILSALSEVDDRIRGLRSGGDDYLTKPFAMGELLARLRAALRRDEGNIIVGQPSRVLIGRWQVDLASYRVTREDTGAPAAPVETLRLTPTEWGILELLLQRPGDLVPVTELLTSVWGPGFSRCTNNLRYHMVQLRRKLEDDPVRPRHLLTEHGMGYRYLP